MRAPLAWIREFTPVEAGVDDIADALEPARPRGRGHRRARTRDRRSGRRADPRGAPASRCRSHPARRRRRRRRRPVRVVCGAPNIEAGMVVPFAPVGAHLPGDFTIERRKIRGQVSEGMLCSARELGLGDDHDGILELPADAAARHRRARGARPRRRRVRSRDHAQPPRRDGHHRRRPGAGRALRAAVRRPVPRSGCRRRGGRRRNRRWSTPPTGARGSSRWSRTSRWGSRPTG